MHQHPQTLFLTYQCQTGRVLSLKLLYARLVIHGNDSEVRYSHNNKVACVSLSRAQSTVSFTISDHDFELSKALCSSMCDVTVLL